MAHDGKLLARARAELERIRSANEAEGLRRKNEIYEKIDGIELIDCRMRAQMTELVRLTLKKPVDLKEQLGKIESENLELQARRAELIMEAGYPEDYLSPIYSCEVCKDSGMRNGKICDCLQKLYNNEVTRNLSSLALNGDESFDNFDPSLYSNMYEPSIGMSEAEYMSLIYKRCRGFVEKFPDKCGNLFMYGDTGLGKTYLSACIAKEISARGCSVCYDTAVSALGAFERQQFSKNPEEAELAGAKVKRELDCDLMILDDLGTEVITSVSISALYTLINTRLTERRPLIINTNLTPEALRIKYTDQICSRIEGCFEPLQFIGSDIRKIKRGL